MTHFLPLTLSCLKKAGALTPGVLQEMYMNIVFAFKILYLLVKKLESEVVHAGEKSTRVEGVAP